MVWPGPSPLGRLESAEAGCMKWWQNVSLFESILRAGHGAVDLGRWPPSLVSLTS